jgi:arylformamidase
MGRPCPGAAPAPRCHDESADAPPDPRAQALLDAQFTLDTIRDLEAVRARRRAAAEEGLRRFEVRRDLPYGAHPAETLNIFPAKGSTGPAPVLVFIHGGFWRSMAAAEFSFLTPGFVPFGASLAVIDYPLIPAVRLADIVESCRRAVLWLHREGAALGLDPERIFIAGNSAGGHLVAELADRAWLRGTQAPSTLVKGATAISGLFDLGPVAASSQNETLRFTPDEVVRFSPLLRPVDIGAPVIVAVGADETEEFLDQSRRFAGHAGAAGVEVDHRVVPGANHITVVLDALADPEAALNRAVRRGMDLL